MKKIKIKSDYSDKNIIENKKSWEKENKKAINSYNERIKKNGLFSDGLRQF
jgi:post-segregation antitoxin (ccd killing protein)